MPKTADELAVYRKFLPGLPTQITVPEPYDKGVFTLEGQELRIIGLPDTPDAIEGTKRYLADYGRLKESASGERELYDAMTKLYPDWASDQTWLMFGLG